MNKNIIIVFTSIFLISCNPISPSTKLKNVIFENRKANPDYIFTYSDTTNNKYLRKLKTEYGLDTMTIDTKNDLKKIKIILNWSHNLWTHNGSNTPSKSDPLTILKEAKAGNNFRCVEYGIVSAAGLNSIGIPARTLALKTRDAEKVKYGAGHVVAEAYSKKLEKWIFIDGQYNAIPVLNNIPLNAVEFQKAIIKNIDSLKIINLKGEISEIKKQKYITWIGKYLFYFDVKFDNRYNLENNKTNSKHKLMLVPINAKNLSVFQRKNKINNCIYTNNINDFYKKPN